MYDASLWGCRCRGARERSWRAIPSEVILRWPAGRSASRPRPSVRSRSPCLPWNIPLAVLLATVGSVVGRWRYFIGALGRTADPRPIRALRGNRRGGSDRADRCSSAGAPGRLPRAMVRWCAPSSATPRGISRMPMGRFLLFSTLGSLPWNAALIYAGFVVGENYPQSRPALNRSSTLSTWSHRSARCCAVARWCWEAARLTGHPWCPVDVRRPRATIASNRTIHRLRGGLESPPGGRSNAEPAREPHRSCADAADLTLGSLPGQTGPTVTVRRRRRRRTPP